MLGAHINLQLKRGVQIITCDPPSRTIEAETRNGEVISINAYHQDATFRWPVPGEKWVVREENGSWYLDGIFETQEPPEGEEVKPGDTVITAGSGTVWKNVDGVLEPLIPVQEEGELIVQEEFLVYPNKTYEPSKTKNTIVIFVARQSHSGPYIVKVDGKKVGTGSVAETFFALTFLVPAGLKFEIETPAPLEEMFASYTFFNAL